MYLNFYKLRKEPFSLAPDPDFLYLSQQHKDALGAIIYGIRAKQGFVCVVGEVGTGKTTIVRTYLQKADRDHILPIFIFNSRISFSELMETFLLEIGINRHVVNGLNSVNEMVTVAHQAMLEKTRQGNTIVLIIDEAQNMPTDTLAKLCILSNFETNKAKLIQIILIGQPELQKKLSLHELRQLKQRIAYKAQITPLSAKDSVNYLHHRLSLVTKESRSIFTANAVKKVVKYSEGIPRIINILCENSLVAGYGLQKKPVSLRIINQVIAEYEGEISPTQPFWTKPAMGGALLVGLSAVLLALYLPSIDLAKVFSKYSDKLTNILKPQGKHVAEEGGHPHNVNRESLHIDDVVSQPGLDDAADAQKDKSAESYQTNVMPHSRFLESFTLGSSAEISKNLRPDGEDLRLAQQGLTNVPPIISQGFESSRLPHLRIARSGDTVSSLCQSTYGFVNDRVLRWVKSHNPHISDLDEIRVNEIIFFPDMETPEYFKGTQAANRLGITAEEIVSR